MLDVSKLKGMSMRRIIIWYIIMGSMAYSAYVFAMSKNDGGSRLNPPSSKLMCTNGNKLVQFHSYMRFRLHDNEPFRYQTRYMDFGYRISFEHGYDLEINKSWYSYCGVTNSYPDKPLFNCIVTPTNIIPNMCIWRCE